MRPASLSGTQCQVARRLLGWDQAQLARAADVSPITLREFENGKPLHNGVAGALMAVLDAAGIKIESDGSVSLPAADQA
jgi:transcriptional regulator with XRE-family HTH domain